MRSGDTQALFSFFFFLIKKRIKKNQGQKNGSAFLSDLPTTVQMTFH